MGAGVGAGAGTGDGAGEGAVGGVGAGAGVGAGLAQPIIIMADNSRTVNSIIILLFNSTSF